MIDVWRACLAQKPWVTSASTRNIHYTRGEEKQTTPKALPVSPSSQRRRTTDRDFPESSSKVGLLTQPTCSFRSNRRWPFWPNHMIAHTLCLRKTAEGAEQGRKQARVTVVEWCVCLSSGRRLSSFDERAAARERRPRLWLGHRYRVYSFTRRHNITTLPRFLDFASDYTMFQQTWRLCWIWFFLPFAFVVSCLRSRESIRGNELG